VLSEDACVVVTCNYVVDSCPADLFFRARSSSASASASASEPEVREILTASPRNRPCDAASPFLSTETQLDSDDESLNGGAGLLFKLAQTPTLISERYAKHAITITTAATTDSSSSSIRSGGGDVTAFHTRSFEAVSRAAPLGTGFAFPVGFLELVRNTLSGLRPGCAGALVVSDKTCGPDDYVDATAPPPGLDRHGSRCVSVAVDLDLLGVALSAAFPHRSSSGGVDLACGGSTTSSSSSSTTGVATFAADSGCLVARQASNVFQSAVFPFCITRERSDNTGSSVTDVAAEAGDSAGGSVGACDGGCHGGVGACSGGCSGGRTAVSGHVESNSSTGTCVAAAFADGLRTFATSDWEALCSLVQERDHNRGGCGTLSDPRIAIGILKLSALDLDAFDDDSLPGLVDALTSHLAQPGDDIDALKLHLCQPGDDIDVLKSHSVEPGGCSAASFESASLPTAPTTAAQQEVRRLVAAALLARFRWVGASAGAVGAADSCDEITRIISGTL
jgi:hypothetical protein